MRKLKLFFACLLMAVLSIGQVWADSYTITLKSSTGNSDSSSGIQNNTTISDFVADGASYVSAVSGTGKVFLGASGYGIKFGNSSGGGSITLTLATAVKPTSIVVSASQFNNTEGEGVFQSQKFNMTGGGGKGNFNDYTVEYDGNTEVTTISVGCTKRGYVKSITVNYGGTPTCATPSFEPAAGAVASGTQVTISCSTEGAAIHYTTDGNAPTASSPTYSSAITVSSATTIKAIAVKDGLSDSEVATAAYTILEPKTISQVMPTSENEGAEFLLNDVTVTYANGNKVYVKDATGYIMVYKNITGAANGKVLHGLQGKAKVYKNLPEISSVTKDPTVNDGSPVDPEALSANPTDDDLNKYVTLEGVTFASDVSFTGSVTNVDGTYKETTIIFRNAFALSGISLTEGTSYRVVGIVQKFNDDIQIYPISFTEIIGETQVATPTFTIAEGTYTSVQSVEIECTTDGASIFYTTDGITTPTAASTPYNGAIEVGESMTIKAIAVKEGLDDSNVASAAYTINLPLPEYTFQVTHHFSTGEGFVFPTGWGGSYAEHEIAYTDDKVHFASASHQSGTITDRPVVKEGAVSLILTNSHKLISAVRFDYSQWTTKVPTLTMKYSTDGGETYSNFNPVVSTTDFVLQVLDMPENVNAIQVVGTTDKQVGLTSIAFDLVDKPIVTKTVTITTPSNGTLVVKNGDDAIASGDAIEVNTVLAIEATPAEGYKLTEVTVNGSAYTEETLTLTENVTIAATFEENLAPLVTSYDLSEIGIVTSHLNGERVGDKVNLPLTAASCSKVFRGWDKDANCAVAPEYAPGAEYTLEADNILYAVYADPSASATWNVATSLEAGDVVVISTNTGYTAHDMKTAGAISSSLFSCLASTYNADNSQITALAEGTLQFTVGGNATDGWTLMNGTKYLKVTAAKKVNLVDDEETWNISFSGNNATLAPATGDLTAYSIQYNYNTGNDRFTAYNTNQVPVSLYKQVASYENYSTDCQAAAATPTFSPVAGTYTEVQNVTISTETADATIYYTTNGDVPTTSSTLYEGAIEVAESKTIKAIAVKDGMANSAVATAAYVINLPLSTVDQIFAAATAAGSTATDANIQFNNWVVSGVSTNGKNVFVTDGTKGFIIFDNGGEMGFAVGDVLSGTVACKVQLYKGAAELTTLSSATEGLNIATGGSVAPQVKAINDLSGINTGAAVTINSVQFDGTNLSDGANSIKPYNSLFAYEDLTENSYYNVTGIYQQFDATKEILPRSAADIEEVSLSDPEISYTPASATIELGQNLPGTTFANPHELAISYTSDNEAVATVSNTGVIALGTETGTAVITASFAGNATYAPANVTYTITVNPASVLENVVILAVYDTKYYAMSTNNASSAFTAIAVEYDGTKVTVISEEDKNAIQWTRKISGENTTFQTKGESPMYMKGTSSGAAMSLNANACNWNWDETNEYYYLGGRSFFYQAAGGYFKNFSISDNMGKTGYSDKAQAIVIDPANIVISSKVSAELAYNPTSDVITEGDAWSAPALVNPYSVTITSYATDNDAVATVTDGGVIALAGGIGTAHITAHFDGDASYLEGDAVYTITVNEVGDDLSGTWTLASSVAAGDKIIIANVAVAGELLTMGAQNGSYREQVASTVDGENKLTPAAGTKVFTLVDASTINPSYEGFALQASNGNYLSSASNSSNNIKEVASVSDANAVWSIVISEGVAAIVAQGSYARKVIRYNSGNTRFSCYAESNTMADVVIYKHGAAPEPVDPDYTEVRNGLTEGWYYTMCLDKAVTAVKAGSIWKVLSKAANGNDVILEEVTGTLDAGRPYIFRAAASTLEVAYTGDAVLAPVTEGNNGLVGSFTQEPIAQSPNNFIIYNNALYFVNSDNVKVGAHRAYLNMTGVPAYSNEPQQGNAPRRRVTMTVYGEQTATGVDAINAAEAPVKMMINGQLFILRGEKMYDATGRLVK